MSEPLASPPAAPAEVWEQSARPSRGEGSLALLTPLLMAGGAAGLIYEVVWTRRLELTFGTATHSVSTVLAAYMIGLGLGSWLLGRVADRPGRTYLRYAALEAGVGIYGLLAPWILNGVDWTFLALGGRGGMFTKACLGILAMLPPTLLLGGTLPVVARSLVQRRAHTQRAIAILYGVNTLGAVAGTLLAGLALVTWLGIDATSRWTGVGNLLLAGAILGLGRRAVPDVPAPAAPEPQGEPAGSDPESDLWLVRLGLWGTFATGAVALALEVAWTRALALALSSTCHAFTIMLAATLTGIGLGSLLASRPPSSPRAPLRLLVASWLVLALACYGFVAGFERLPRLVYLVAGTGALYYEQLIGLELLLCGLVLLPATLALGVAFPLCTQLGSPRAGAAGASVGRIYMANTLGAVLGSLGSSFALVLLIGTQDTIRLCGALAALGAVVVVSLSWPGESNVLRSGPRPVQALGLTLVLALVALPAWDSALLDMDPLRREKNVPNEPGAFESRCREGGASVLFAEEGLNTRVSVRSWGPLGRVLRLGGKNDASTMGDMDTQLLLSLAPLLASPTPRRTLVVGAGSGVSARVLADQPGVEAVDVVELERAVIAASSRWFDIVNDGVFQRDRVRVIYEDARTVLQLGGPAYDVIAAEPTNPSIAGVANLFSLEHYRNARARLSPQGVYAQWIQLYASSEPMARAMLRTFLEAFPHVDVWRADPTDLILLGSERPLRYDLEAARRTVEQNPGLRRDLWARLSSRSAEELFGRFVCSGEELRPLLAGATVLHDQLPLLESWAARARYERVGTDLLRQQLEQVMLARSSPWPAGLVGAPAQPAAPWLARARFELQHNALDAARLALGRAGHGPETALLGAWLAPDPLAAMRAAAAAAPDDLELSASLGLLLAQHGDLEQARPLLAALEPRLAAAGWTSRYCLARALTVDLQRRGGGEELVTWARRGIAAALPRPDEQTVRGNLIWLLVDQADRVPEAETLLASLWDGGDHEELDLGLALATARVSRGQLQGCLDVLDLLEREHNADDLPALRLLRLRALTRGRLPGLAGELSRFLADFPEEAKDVIVLQARQALQ